MHILCGFSNYWNWAHCQGGSCASPSVEEVQARVVKGKQHKWDKTTSMRQTSTFVVLSCTCSGKLNIEPQMAHNNFARQSSLTLLDGSLRPCQVPNFFQVVGNKQNVLDLQASSDKAPHT